MPSQTRGDSTPGDRLGNALATTARTRAQVGVPPSNRRTLPAGPVGYPRPTVAPVGRVHRRQRTGVGRFVHLHRHALRAAVVALDIVFYIAGVLAVCIADYPSALVLVVLAGVVAWSRRD